MQRSRICLTVIFFGLLTSLIPLRLDAQNYDAEYTLGYINERLTDVCKIFGERKGLRVEFYSNGEPVRVDYINPASIDYEEGIYYADDEHAIILSCYEEAGKCIERQIIKHGSRLFYDRTNLGTACSGDACKGLETALEHLIMLYVLDDYERTQPFEEN